MTPQNSTPEKVAVVSACLWGANCRYDGKNQSNEKLHRLLAGWRIILICPEMAAGLTVPRLPAEIRNGQVFRQDGVCLQEAYQAGIQKVMDKLNNYTVSLVVLQPRSPACGVRQVYDGTFSHHLINGMGLLAQKLIASGYTVIQPDELTDWLLHPADKCYNSIR